MWNGWPIHRILFLFTGIIFLAISLQVYLFHSRQNFRHWAMYSPVLAGPLLGVLSILVAFYNLPWLRSILALLFVVGTLQGIYGSVLHIAGIGQRVGGYQTQNVLIGPPVTLPALITGMSLLGLIALYWR